MYYGENEFKISSRASTASGFGDSRLVFYFYTYGKVLIQKSIYRFIVEFCVLVAYVFKPGFNSTYFTCIPYISIYVTSFMLHIMVGTHLAICFFQVT